MWLRGYFSRTCKNLGSDFFDDARSFFLSVSRVPLRQSNFALATEKEEEMNLEAVPSQLKFLPKRATCHRSPVSKMTLMTVSDSPLTAVINHRALVIRCDFTHSGTCCDHQFGVSSRKYESGIIHSDQKNNGLVKTIWHRIGVP